MKPVQQRARWSFCMRLFVYSSVLCLATLPTAEAAALKAFLKHLGKVPGETAQGAGRVLKKAIGESGDGLESAVKKIGREGAASSDDVLARLKQIGPLDDLPAMTRELNAISPAARFTLLQMMDDSERIVRISGMPADQVIRSLEKGGADAVFEVRKMQSPEGLRACLKGFDEFGDRFTDFARRADEAGVKRFDELKPQLSRLSKHQLDDILNNPTRYLDADGRTLRPLDDLLQSAPKPTVLGRASQAYRVVKDGVFVAGAGLIAYLGYSVYSKVTAFRELVRHFLEPWVGSTLANGVSQAVWWLLLLAMVWVILALFFPWVRPLVLRSVAAVLCVMKWIVKHTAGEAAAPLMKTLQQLSSSIVSFQQRETFAPGLREWGIFRRPQKRSVLRIGLLGYKRVGKTTFTVMLRKKLDQLVPGSDLSELTQHPDGDVMENMALEVAECRPTREDKHVSLKLVWPFGRDGQSGGTMDMQLDMADFPGEWASRGANPVHRRSLADHLRRVDGLLIVIDPTDLEAEPNFKDRLASQKDAIESMFRDDGLDMGRSFRRAIAIVITKRDALTPELLERFSTRGDESSKDQLDAMKILSQREQLSIDESGELGIWILGCLCPTLKGKLITMLGGVSAKGLDPDSKKQVVGWSQYLRASRDWLTNPTSPQLKVFCVSQMGVELGRQVVEHRRRIQEWERNGSQGDRPTISLDLDDASTNGMDLHFPFRWLFDQIPAGWLHECAGGTLGRRELARWLGPFRRFHGAPAVQDAISTSWRKIGVSLVGIVGLFFAVGPVFRVVDAHLEAASVRHMLTTVAAGHATPDELRDELTDARGKSTRPYATTLTIFETLIKQHVELDGFAAVVNDDKSTLQSRVESARDWMQLQSQLAEGDRDDERQLLAIYVKRLREPTTGVLRQMRKHCEELSRMEPTSDAYWKLIRELRTQTEKVGLCHSENAEAVRRDTFDQLTSLLVDHEVVLLKQQVDVLTAKQPADYSEAFGLLDSALLAEYGTSGRKSLHDLRTKTVRDFWETTQASVDHAAENGDIQAVDAHYRSFVVLAGSPNEFQKIAEVSMSESTERVVDAQIKKAGRERDHTKQWELLKGLEIHLNRVPSVVRDQWCVIGAQAKQGLHEWRAAHLLLGQVDNEQLKKSRLSEFWQQWIAYLESQVPRLLKNEKVDDVRGLIVTFKQSHPSPELLDRCRRLEVEIPRVELQAVLKQADALGSASPLKALELLLNVADNIDANRDQETVREWRRKTVELFQRLDRHPDAGRFLEQLQQKAPPFPAHDPQLAEELWKSYFVKTKSHFEKGINDPSAADAWRILRERARDERVPATTREELHKLAREQLVKKLPDPKGDAKALAAARKQLEQIKLSAESWRQDKAVADQLQMTEEKLVAAEFDVELSGLTARAHGDGLSRTVHEGIHDDFRKLISKTGLSPAQKSRATSESAQHLLRWEKHAYQELFNAHKSRDFKLLSDHCRHYLDKAVPYDKQRPAVAVNEVAKIEEWLEAFDKSATYSITGIPITGLPAYSYRSYFDPAVEVRIGKLGSQTSISVQANSQSGNVTLVPKGLGTFTWKKGDPIEIEIWDDAIRKQGYCLGVVRFAGDYSLLDVVTRKERVPCEKHDYKSYPDVGNVHIGLTVAQAGPLTLPKLTQR